MPEKVLKSTQEQATASWIHYLNYLRFCERTERFSMQDLNLEKSMEEFDKLKRFVSQPEHILGNPLTKHGEIAERAQVYVSNALNLVDGLLPEYEIDSVPRLDKADYLYNGKMVQSKFCYGLAGSERAVNLHLDTYPNYLDEEGFYMIAKNNHEEFARIYSAGESGSFVDASEKKYYEAIKDWENETGHKFTDVVKPSRYTYDDVQLDRIDETISRDEKEILTKDRVNREKIQKETVPSYSEGLKVTAASAAIEGGFSFALSIYQKKKAGTPISEFTSDDWKDIGLDTVTGSLKGGIRGATVYALTNFTPTPAPIASALVTATFGVMSEALKLRKGIIDVDEFIDSSEVMCLDVSVSAISSILGQTLIPIPILGTIIGNATGMYLLNISRTYLSEEEQKIIQLYIESLHNEEKQFDKEYQDLLDLIQKEISTFDSLVDLAFDPDVNVRFESSIDIARFVGVDESRIIKSAEEGENYFTN